MRGSPWVDDEIADLQQMAAKFVEAEAVSNRERWEQQKYVDHGSVGRGTVGAAVRIDSGRVRRFTVDDCIVEHLRRELDAVTASMAKVSVTEMQCQVIERCLQLFGRCGYMLEYPIMGMYADSRAQKIYAGTNEVMKELIARSL